MKVSLTNIDLPDKAKLTITDKLEFYPTNFVRFEEYEQLHYAGDYGMVKISDLIKRIEDLEKKNG